MLMTGGMGLDLQELRSRLAGTVTAPGDPSWDEARQAWNLAVDQRPALVALPENVDDVVAIVEFARAAGLRVAAQGTGHNAAAVASLDDTVLVKTSRMKGVAIDVAGRCDRDHEPGLFWALRGGGGSFGVVTAIEFALYPAPEVYGGAMLWPWERATEILNRYVEWSRTAPDAVST